MNKKNKVLVIFIVILMLIFGSVMGVLASDSLLYESTGRIEIDQNNDGILEAVFDAQDIFDIDNEITTGKKNVASAINDYSNANISSFPTFENIVNSINNLTDVPADTYFYDKNTGVDDASTLKRYIKIAGSYYECDESGNKISDTSLSDTINVVAKDDTSTPSEGEIYLVEYVQSKDKNLSVGFAGYVDKQLVLGDGADNISYRNLAESDIEDLFARMINYSSSKTSWNDTATISYSCPPGTYIIKSNVNITDGWKNDGFRYYINSPYEGKQTFVNNTTVTSSLETHSAKGTISLSVIGLRDKY